MLVIQDEFSSSFFNFSQAADPGRFARPRAEEGEVFHGLHDALWAGGQAHLDATQRFSSTNVLSHTSCGKYIGEGVGLLRRGLFFPGAYQPEEGGEGGLELRRVLEGLRREHGEQCRRHLEASRTKRGHRALGNDFFRVACSPSPRIFGATQGALHIIYPKETIQQRIHVVQVVRAPTPHRERHRALVFAESQPGEQTFQILLSNSALVS